MVAPIDTPNLGPFLIVQLAVAGAIAVGTVFGIWKGLSGKSKTEATAGPGVQWFLDGPIGRALDILAGIYREIKQMREDNQRFANERNLKMDETNGLLRDIKERSAPRRPH